MFATTSGHVHRASLSELFAIAQVVSAQLLCVFGNGADRASPHSDAHSERVVGMLFSRPGSTEAVVVCVSQKAGGTRLTQGGGRSVRPRD